MNHTNPPVRLAAFLIAAAVMALVPTQVAASHCSTASVAGNWAYAYAGTIFTPNGDLPGLSTGNLVGAYAIGANGALTPVAGSPYSTGNYPLGAASDPDGKVLSVANSLDGTISTFNIDARSGGLTEISGSPFSAGANWHGLSRCVFALRVDAGGRVLYDGDACNPAMPSFTIDSAGALSAPVVTETDGASSTYLGFVQVP